MLTLLVALSLLQAPLAADAPTLSNQRRLVEIDFALKSVSPAWPVSGAVALVTGYSTFAVLGGLATFIVFATLDARMTATDAALVGVAFYGAAILSGLGLIVGTGALIWSAITAGENRARKRQLDEERTTLMGNPALNAP